MAQYAPITQDPAPSIGSEGQQEMRTSMGEARIRAAEAYAMSELDEDDTYRRSSTSRTSFPTLEITPTHGIYRSTSLR